MKIKKYHSLKNNGKSFKLRFSPSWDQKKKHHFTITMGNVVLKLGGKEAKLLHTFLNKIF